MSVAASPAAAGEQATVPRLAQAGDLRSLSGDELAELFAAGTVPDSVRVLDGHPAGIGVGLIVLTGGLVERLLRRYSERDDFIWHGKSFESRSDDEGWGWNRFGVGPVLGAFPFRTSIGPSLTDGEPAILLNFDVPKNPWWERRTWDELREVMPGVFMGPTGLRIGGGYHKLAWFAVDTTTQTPLRGA